MQVFDEVGPRSDVANVGTSSLIDHCCCRSEFGWLICKVWGLGT